MDNMNGKLGQLFCVVITSFAFCLFLSVNTNVFAQQDDHTTGGTQLDSTIIVPNHGAGYATSLDEEIKAAGVASSTDTQLNSGRYSLTGSYWTGFASIDHSFILQNIASLSNDEEGRLGLSWDALELLSVLENGNVGIGTATPGEKLTVNGIIESISGGIKFPDGTIQTTAATGLSRMLDDNSKSYYGLGETSNGDTIGVINISKFIGAAGDSSITPNNLLTVFSNKINNYIAPAGVVTVGDRWNFNDETNAIFNNNSGNVGIGTTSPGAKLDVEDLRKGINEVIRLSYKNALNSGSKISWWAENAVETNRIENELTSHATASGNLNFYTWTHAGGLTEKMKIMGSGNVGIGTTSPSAMLDVNGTTRTKVLEITGGADISEQFDIYKPVNIDAVIAHEDLNINPGMVVCIDSENPGKLLINTEAYDKRVAGIISGAGGVKTGMMMGQKSSVADGQYPVALTGRVYAYADATEYPIKPGDLLTTSDTPGHAMKVSEYADAHGAILGKAMSPLDNGKGLVLVLVTLH